MTPALLTELAIIPGLRLLPRAMDTPEARAMLFAMARQESKLEYRHQINGPAKGYWQFEAIGVAGVLQHPASSRFLVLACAQLDIAANIHEIYTALEFCDPLACVCARLNLWTWPGFLPTRDEPAKGWQQYLKVWRPGKPHHDRWADNFTQGWLDSDASYLLEPKKVSDATRHTDEH